MKLNIAPRKTSHLFILLAFALFAGSLGPICVRYAQSYGLTPDLITAIRMVFSSVLFFPLVWSKHSQELKNMPTPQRFLALSAGVMFGTHIVLMVTSLEHISIMINQVLIATTPIWVALLEVTVLKTKLRLSVWLGIIVAFTGGTIIAFSTSNEPAFIENGNATLGVILAIFSALGSSIYLIIGRKLRASTSFLPYVWLVYTGGSIIALLIMLFNQSPIIGYDPRGYIWVIALAIVAQIIAHGTFNFILGYLPATTVSVSSQAVPILGTIWAFFIFTEIPTLLQIIGSGIIIVGVTIVIRTQNQSKRKPK